MSNLEDEDNIDITDYEEEEEEEEEPYQKRGDGGGDAWLISYADMMTLIACFFILMMVFAIYDTVTFQRRAELIAKYFQGESDISEDPMANLQLKLETISNIEDEVIIEQTAEGLEIVMNVKTLFEIGSARINPDYKILITNTIDEIFETNPDARIIVEGHTDDIPFRQGDGLYGSNWELSGARAASVLNMFDERGFSRDHMLAVGYADTRPAFPNRDENGNPIDENRLKNRRIVIRVLEKPGETRRMGLGVLFSN